MVKKISKKTLRKASKQLMNEDLFDVFISKQAQKKVIKKARPKKKIRWEYAGECGVDSGQIMIVDPCYIDSNWVKQEFTDVREVEYKGKRIEAPNGMNGSWDDVFPYNRKYTWNEAKKNGIIRELDPSETKTFSYDGACRATLGRNGCGQLGIMAPLAVASRTAFGDGVYPVYVKKDKDDTILEVKIKFA